LGEIVDSVPIAGFVEAGNNLLMMNVPAWAGRLVPGIIDRTPLPEMIDDVAGPLRELQGACVYFGLNVTLRKIDRLLVRVENEKPTYSQIRADARSIQETLRDELSTKLFLHVLPENAPYYSEPLADWDLVMEHFPSVSFDIEEASKSFALERYTASVFHLMRVSEAGLRSIAERVGLVNSRPNWDEAIRYIEGQLRKNYDEMDSIFKGDVEFLSGIAAHMRSVNLAWRRNVSHIERNYSREESKGIYDSTLSVMRHISKTLTEIED
jgi:hypothetical protein